MTKDHHGNREHSLKAVWKKKWSGWIKKHKAMVTVVSALTVLTSFIVKDALDEPAKERLSAIESAIRDNNNEQSGLYTQLTDINSNLRAVRDKLMEGRPISDAEAQRLQLSAENTKALERFGQNYAHLVVLDQVLSPAFKEKKKAFDQKYQQLQSTEKTDSVEGLAKSVRDYQALYDESRFLRGEGVQELDKLKENTEICHRWYGGIAYVSFGLGWIVGLCSSLVGRKSGSTGE